VRLGLRPALVVAVGILAAAALALVGVAVLDVSGQAREDDSRILRAPAAPDAERHDRGLSVRVGEAILGIADDRSYRDAVEFARAAVLPGQAESVTLELRAASEGILAAVLRGDGAPELRSRAANLLGVLYFQDAQAAQENPRRFLENALGALQDAVRLDPTNETAKTNLELVATVPAHTRFRRPSRPGTRASAAPNAPGGY
jgi:hypothetical protein